MRFPQRSHAVGGVVALAFAATLAAGQNRPEADPATVIPRDASALQGVPTVRLDVTSDGVRRQELDRDRAAAQALKVEIVDGRFYWTSREKRPLTLTTVGEFTYLMSTEPGKYIRFRKLNDRLAYVEHVDMEFGSVTYWGELRIVLGK